MASDPASSWDPSGHRDAAFGLCEADGRVLLVRNPRVAGGRAASFWDLPGGSVAAGERLREALVREWREETGLAGEAGGLLLVVDGRKRRPGGALLYGWRAFVFRLESRGEAVAGPGIDEVAWVDRGEAASRLDAPWHGPVRDLLRGSRLTYAQVDWEEPALPETGEAGSLRSLLVIGACAAAGEADLLAREIDGALRAGEDPARIEEALLQVVPYAGFPRALAAFAVLRRLVPSPASGRGAPPSGEDTFDRVYGETSARVAAGLRVLHPDLARWTFDFAYGSVIGRGGLDLRSRELLAVSILTALGGPDEPLLGHMRAALRLGAPREQVEGAVRVVPVSLGAARRDAARALLARL